MLIEGNGKCAVREWEVRGMGSDGNEKCGNGKGGECEVRGM